MNKKKPLINYRIENFKSIQNSSLESNANAICLIGANETGKTNILESLMRLQKTSTFKDEDFLMWNDSSKEDGIKLSLELNVETQDYYESLDAYIKEYSKKSSVICNFVSSFYDDKKNKTILWKFERNTDPIQPWKNGIANSAIPDNIERFENCIKEELTPIIKGSGAYFMNDTLRTKYKLDFFMQAINGSKLVNEDKKFVKNTIEIFKWVSDLNQPLSTVQINYEHLFLYEDFEINLLNSDSTDEKLAVKKAILFQWLKIVGVKPLDLLSTIEGGNTREIMKMTQSFNDRTKSFFEKVMKAYMINENIELQMNIMANNMISIKILDTYKTKVVDNLDMKSRSSGFKAFIGICLILASYGHDKIPTIILIDEPEKCLNPLLQENLIKHIQGFLTNHKNKFLIYATHSPYMIDIRGGIDNKLVYRNIQSKATCIANGEDSLGKTEISNSDLLAFNLVFNNSVQLKTIFQQIAVSRGFKFCVFFEGADETLTFYKWLEFFEPQLFNQILAIPLHGSRSDLTFNLMHSFISKEIDPENWIAILDFDKGGEQIKNVIDEYIGDNKNTFTYLDFAKIDFKNEIPKIFRFEEFLGRGLTVKETYTLKKESFNENNNSRYKRIAELLKERIKSSA